MDKLYGLMNWRNIEGLEYSDIGDPKSVLGIKLEKSGNRVGVYAPGAKSLSVKLDGVKKLYPMELMDESGYFAVLLPKTVKGNYKIVEESEDGTKREYYDAYQFDVDIPESELHKFNAGICYEAYKYLGAHKTVINGVTGYSFAVWAPNADRVSVVGDFNNWDGRRNMMERMGDSGVFALFIPEIEDGSLYKYEIRKKDGNLIMKADPYGFKAQLRPETASVTCDIDSYKWSDGQWIKDRAKKNAVKEPISIYEVHLGSVLKPEMKDVEVEAEDLRPEQLFMNYRELAPALASYVKDMGYTHIELMPVMEHPLDESWGYQVTGYYAASSRYGSPEDLMYFMDYMHREGIGVILDWVPAHFPKDAAGLAKFDGTCLYEDENPLRGEHPDWGTLIFNYGRPEVSNFLIANAFFWVDKYHADGLRIDAVASMLYLDYGRRDGNWQPNIYGGNENLEAVEFFKHLNSQFKKRMPGALLIAEDSTAWPMMTGDVEDEGLGFDFKWNMGWMNDFLSYMGTNPYFRKNVYNQLTFSMIYQYSENFVLVYSHDEVVHGKGSMFGKMAGANDDEKFANLRAAYGYMMTHPGKKLTFMGQDFGTREEWSESKALNWDELKNEKNKGVNEYVKALNALYKSEPSLYELDQEVEGFNWINCVSPSNSTVSFVRNSSKENDMLVVVCNFDTVPFPEFKLGVPKYGKYKEVLNSDDVKFGGTGLVNTRVKTSKKEKYDGKNYTISISLPALSVTVLKYEYVEEKIVEKKTTATKVEENKTVKTTKSKLAATIEKEIEKEAKARDKAETKNIDKLVKGKPAVKKTATKKTTTEKKPVAKAEEKPAVEKVVKEAKPVAKKTVAKAEEKPAVKKTATNKTTAEKKPVAKTAEKPVTEKKTPAKKMTTKTK